MTQPTSWHGPARYQIKVKGQLGKEWSEWFECLSVESEGSFTTITADFLDQSALHGLLVRVRDLGLPLISVSRIEQEPAQEK